MSQNLQLLRASHAGRDERSLTVGNNPTRARTLALIISNLIAAVVLLLVVAPARLAAQSLSVFPDGNAVLKGTSSSGTATFSLAGLVNGQTYFREIYCTGQVINCGSTTPQSFTAPLASLNVTYQTTSTNGSGRLLLKVYRAGMTPMDTGWFNFTVDASPPDIRLLVPTSSVSTDLPSIQIAWCDNGALNAATRSISVNGIDRTTSFDYSGGTGPADCTAKATSSSASIPVAVGNNTLVGYICDTFAHCTQKSFTIIRSQRGIAVRSELLERQNFVGTSDAQRFFVKNLEAGNANFTLSPACSGVASACTVTPANLSNVRPGESRTATVTYSVAAGGTGSATLKAFDSAFQDSASVVVTPVAVPAPLVSVAEVNPGTAFERDGCLTIATGKGAAYECGDLRLVQPLPAIRTMNKARAPALLYNSAYADPYPIVAANVTLASTASVPDSIEAVLTVGGAEKTRGRWAGSDWIPGGTRRIALGYADTSNTTNAYDYSLEVATISGSTRTPTSVTGKLIVVSRRNSAFGAGWWLAGLEHLELLADSSKLWIGGDGSARLYARIASGLWVSPNVDAPDTLRWDGTTFVRSLSDGLKVKFNSTGQHVATIERLGQQTSFGYSNGRLASITLPVAGGAQSYAFAYDGTGHLDSVLAPGARNTAIWVTASRVDSIGDAGLGIAKFTYEDAISRRVATRTDRRGTTTSYSYDNGKKLSRVNVNLQPDSIRVGFSAQETRGLLSAIPRTSVDTAAVYADFYGPRTFATRQSDRLSQETWFYLDRFGAPTRIRDALNHVTTVRREDGQWPALATEVTDASGFVTRAGYDARGNIIRSISLNPFGDGRDTVTRYHWDARWDAVDSVITPMGIVTTIGYDTTNGNRLWQQMGSDTARRVYYRYGNSEKLLSSVLQRGVTVDSLVYDGQWNLSATRTAGGYWTSYYNDGLGRDTLTVTPIDSADRSRGGAADTTSRRRDRVRFDVMDRDWFSESIARSPDGSTEAVQVTKRYDAEGNVDSVARVSVPDPTNPRIGAITTLWHFDRANRRVAEVAPDSSADSTDYDPAGNVVSSITRRTDPNTGVRLIVTMNYDALNRMVTRILPQVSYASRATHFNIQTPWPIGSYPVYTIPVETHSFTYDPAGRLLTADNADAKVKRTYYPNGLVETDSLRIQTIGHDDWERHKYGLRNSYDFDGRRTVVVIPHQLRVGSDSTISYTYDPQLGLEQTVTDLQKNVFALGYNLVGQLGSIAYPGFGSNGSGGTTGISEAFAYDIDGRLAADTIWNDRPTAWPSIPTSPVRATRFYWDARSKLLLSGDGARFRDTLSVGYSGLGNVQSSVWLQHGCASCDLGPDSTHVNREDYHQDALGNRTLSSVVDQVQSSQGFSQSGSCCDTLRYQPTTGRLASVTPPNVDQPRTTYLYNSAGDEEFSWATAPAAASSERASFYAADGSLRMVDTRSAVNDHAQATQTQQYAVEDYRYDALGRRVWVRARKRCDDYGMTRLASAECRTSLVRRTIWDGGHELAEIQMPWALQGTGLGSYDSTMTPEYWDNDTLPASLPTVKNSGDPNPYFGYVVYAGRRDIDQPLAITRVNYAWAVDWYNPSNTSSPPQVKAAFTIVPFWAASGDAPQGVVNTGDVTICNPPNQHTECVGLQWPWDASSTDREGSLTRGSWHGSLIEHKRDKSGFGYMRNRYYNPRTGRFVQEDPAGLAGGLNGYGFAGGDPINYSDPFGLCPYQLRTDLAACQAWNKKQLEKALQILNEERARGNPSALRVTLRFSPANGGELKGCPSPDDYACIYLGTKRNVAIDVDRSPEAISSTIVHEQQHDNGYMKGRTGTEECAQARQVDYVNSMSHAHFEASQIGSKPARRSMAYGSKEGCL